MTLSAFIRRVNTQNQRCHQTVFYLCIDDNELIYEKVVVHD